VKGDNGKGILSVGKGVEVGPSALVESRRIDDCEEEEFQFPLGANILSKLDRGGGGD
jgi:hypothetical protein